MMITDFYFRIARKDYMLNQEGLDFSILIKTFKRPDNLKRLLYSLERLRCKVPIFIGDDSPEPYEAEIKALFPTLDIRYLVLPFDTGLSEGRNLMLAQVTTPYFLLCDDDFIFDKRSRAVWMKQLLVQHNLDILGGVFFEYRPQTKWEWRWRNLVYRLVKKNIIIPATTIYNYYGNYRIVPPTCYLEKPVYQPPFTICSFCHNYFIGKTASIRQMGGWKKALKVGEHENFFVKATLNGIKVATTQEAGIIHGNFYDSNNNYHDFRNRSQQLQVNSLEEFGITKVENYEATVGFAFGNENG